MKQSESQSPYWLSCAPVWFPQCRNPMETILRFLCYLLFGMV